MTLIDLYSGREHYAFAQHREITTRSQVEPREASGQRALEGAALL